MKQQSPQERRPGMPCPECKFFIEMPMEDILYKSSFVCPGCGLKLELQRQQSQTSLAALQQLHVAMKNMDSVKKQAENPSHFPQSGRQ